MSIPAPWPSRFCSTQVTSSHPVSRSQSIPMIPSHKVIPLSSPPVSAVGTRTCIGQISCNTCPFWVASIKNSPPVTKSSLPPVGERPIVVLLVTNIVPLSKSSITSTSTIPVTALPLLAKQLPLIVISTPFWVVNVPEPSTST